MTKRALKTFAAATILTVVSILLAPQAATAASGKIQFDIENSVLALGESTTVTIALDQPIICADPARCSVTLDFTASVPAGMTVTPASINWTANEWAQARTVTVAVSEDANDLFGQTVSIGGTVESGSEYYQGYQGAFDVNVPAPIAYNQRTLANTGSNDLALGFELGLALLMILAGLRLKRVVRK